MALALRVRSSWKDSCKMRKSLTVAELQNLRRYAFCLVGNQALGDIAVEAALKTVAQPADNEPFSGPSLYRKIADVAFSDQNSGQVSGAFGNSVQTRFLRLPPIGRQIAALRAVIGFSYQQISEVFDIPQQEARRIYIDALRTLRDEPATVLIIEDEYLIALDLQQIVTNLGLSVAGMARNRGEALRIAARTKPELILADYKLGGDTGTEVVKAIRERQDAKVIYVTAHPDIIGRECGGETVIAKPFSRRQVELAVQAGLAA